MMNTMMAVPVNTGVGESLAFLAFPAKRASEEVSATTEEMVRTISTLVSQILAEAVGARSKEQFLRARKTHIARYMQVMIALSDLIAAAVDEPTIGRLTVESLSELETMFKEGERIFGPFIGEQAVFTVWTFGKISELVQQCNAKRVSHEYREADAEFARQYVGHVLYARFHLDCLRMSLMQGQPLFPEVLDEISEGLRSAVDAYAYVRHGMELRHPTEEELMIDIPWDEEQDELLRLSSEDLLREVY